MANYYSDHPEIGFHLNHPLMKRIVELRERDYEDAKTYADAPVDYIPRIGLAVAGAALMI